MLLALMVVSLVLVSAVEQKANDDWVDPHDMLHYDSASKTTSKPTEINEQKKKIALLSGQPTCNQVFKRFLTRLQKEMQKVGLPTDSSEAFYDAKVGVSKEAITEIQKLLDRDGSFTAGALDYALSQLVVNLKQREVRKWPFEDSFGVELDTLFNIVLLVLVATVIGSIPLWAIVRWSMQPSRLFAVWIVWKSLFLCMNALVEHNQYLWEMDIVKERCTVLLNFSLIDSIKEWYGSIWTVQDDPCKIYYNLLFACRIMMISPITLFVCVSVPTVFLHGIIERLCRRSPPPPGLQQPQQQPQAQIQGVADLDPLAGRDTHQQGPR